MPTAAIADNALVNPQLQTMFREERSYRYFKTESISVSYFRT